MIVNRTLRWRLLRTLACLACFGGATPATAGADPNDPADRTPPGHARGTEVIAAAGLGAGMALILASAFVEGRHEVVTAVQYFPDQERLATTTAEVGSDTTGLLLAGLTCVFLGVAMLFDESDMTSVADNEAMSGATAASRLEIRSVQLDGRPSAGIALAF